MHGTARPRYARRGSRFDDQAPHKSTSSSYGDFVQEEPTGGVQARATRPGLVLLYAPNFDQFYSAYVFGGQELIIGRDPSNPVCVPEQAVSRQHARITSDGRRWILSDLGSRNGTMVDGQFVHEVELQHLHEIRVGDAIFKFVESGAERYVSYRIDGAVAGERRAKQLAELVGGCQIDAIAADVERIAPTELSCVILGETGTGKEVAARGVHRASGLGAAPSRPSTGAAIPPEPPRERAIRATAAARSPAPTATSRGSSSSPTAAPCSSTRSATCRWSAQAKLLRVLQAREVFPARRDDGRARGHPRRVRDAPRSQPVREGGEVPRGTSSPA